MTSEWETVINKKHNPKEDKNDVQYKNDVHYTKPVKEMDIIKSEKGITKIKRQIIKYSVDFINTFKAYNKEQQVSYELSLLFDKINDMFKTSTQYLESKKKINYNQHNHNRWEATKDSDNSIINIIYSCLNRITEKNYNDIIEEIKKQEIFIYDDLDKLTEKVIQKCVSDNQFISLYVKVIKFIITDCKWIVEDNNQIPVTFRRIIINQIEMRFCNLINDIKNMKYDTNENELIVIHNKARKGLIVLIAKLYEHKIIGNQLIRLIFNIFECSYSETKIEQYIEYWLFLLKFVVNIWNKNEKQYLDEKIDYILKIKNQFTYKIMFLIEDILDDLNKEKYVIPVQEEVIENDIISINYDLLILSISEYDDLDGWYNDIKDNIVNIDKFLEEIIIFTISNKTFFDNIIILLKFLLNKNIITKEEIQNKCIKVKETEDLSDCYFFEKHLDNYSKLTN